MTNHIEKCTPDDACKHCIEYDEHMSRLGREAEEKSVDLVED